MKVVTRIAPSPTGLLHCGTLRTALYNYLFAKQNGGIFYLRIEDTDQKRFVAEAEDYIKRSFEWAGFEPDFSPWKPGPGHFSKLRQSERDYSHHIKYLLDTNQAYLAFDSEQELADARQKDTHFSYGHTTRMKMRNSLTLSNSDVQQLLDSGAKYVVRFNTPVGKTIKFVDMVRGEVSFNSDLLDDKVLVKSNGIPTYHLASVCDDHDMETTHVIRGEEWLPSTPLHIMLYKAFDWQAPEFAHLPTIMRPDGRGKFSKRDALKYDVPIFPFGGSAEDDKGNLVKYKGFQDQGFEADAVLNFLLLLGWSPEDDREIFSLDDMLKHFSIDRVHKAGAKYDIDKAIWFNSQYLQTRSYDSLVSSIACDEKLYSNDRMQMIVELAKVRSNFRSDMQKVADIFFKPVTPSFKKIDSNFKDVISDFINSDDWSSVDKIKETLTSICDVKEVKIGKIMPNLRIALTGGVPGPELFTTMYILGEKETKKRLGSALS